MSVSAVPTGRNALQPPGVQTPGYYQASLAGRACAHSRCETHGFRIACMRPVFDWLIGSRSLQLGKRTLIMGVVNVTPDSFSDGGTNFDHDRAVEYAIKLLAGRR